MFGIKSSTYSYLITIYVVLMKFSKIAADDVYLPNDFGNLTEELYFVDKTELIRNILYQPHKFIYISRPRKYGKSMNLNMIKLFLNVQVNKQGDIKNYTRTSAYLRAFRNSYIGNDFEFVQEHMTNYPVILLDLKSIDHIALDDINEETVQKYLNVLLHESFKSYQWLLDIPREKLVNGTFGNFSIQTDDINFMEKLSNKKLTLDEIQTGLGRLMRILLVYFQRKIVLLIDEYDRLILHGKMTATNVELLYKHIDEIIDNIFEPEISNTIVRGLITGTRKESFSRHPSFSQNVMPQWLLDDELVTSFFGFSDDELESLFRKYNCGFEDENSFKKYYGNQETALEKESIYYNPYAAAIYFANKLNNKNQLVNHWFLHIDNEHYLDGLFL